MKGEEMRGDPQDVAVHLVAGLLAAVFLALQIFFVIRGDAHIATLMCGACLACVGMSAGWSLAGRKRGGDGE